MHALVIYCHPSETSFTAGVRDTVLERLRANGATYEVIDLYAEGFEPVLPRGEWEAYLDGPAEDCPHAPHCEMIRRANALIFVYPTWWYGLPAMLKGWLDRVFMPEVAFHLPADGPITPALTHIDKMAVFTSCGASWALTRFIGAPGRRTLLRGVRLLCAKRCKTVFRAHYNMDRSTPESRTAHLARVAAAVDGMVPSARAPTAAQPAE